MCSWYLVFVYSVLSTPIHRPHTHNLLGIREHYIDRRVDFLTSPKKMMELLLHTHASKCKLKEVLSNLTFFECLSNCNRRICYTNTE